MKSLLSVINETLTKKLKEGTPLIDLSFGKTFFSQRGAKKFLNVEAIEKDYKNLEGDIKSKKNLMVYTVSHSERVSDIEAKACLLILSQTPYYEDYRKIEQAMKTAAQKYSIDDIYDVRIKDFVNTYEDLTGNLYILVMFSRHAKLQIDLHLDGFVAGKYKTEWVGNGVDIYHDEFKGYDDQAAFARTGVEIKL